MKRAPNLPPDRAHIEPEGAAAVGPDAAKPKHRRGHDYEVGYARPPAKTKYKKGVSGNPRGRPKKPPPTRHQLLLRILAERITVTIDGRAVRMSKNEARLLVMSQKAMAGDLKAQKELDHHRKLFPFSAPPPEINVSLARKKFTEAFPETAKLMSWGEKECGYE